jgi:hypothetical protein
LDEAPQESFDQTFSKVCRAPPAKRRSLVATSEILFNGALNNFLLIFLENKNASGGKSRPRRECAVPLGFITLSL